MANLIASLRWPENSQLENSDGNLCSLFFLAVSFSGSHTHSFLHLSMRWDPIASFSSVSDVRAPPVGVEGQGHFYSFNAKKKHQLYYYRHCLQYLPMQHDSDLFVIECM